MTGGRAPAAVVPPALAAEWDDVHAHVRDRVVGLLRGLGVSAATADYVGGLRLYLRAPYLLTLWVPDPGLRRQLSYDLTLHVIAMKLFDDLADGDAGIDRYELASCLLLWTQATNSLGQRSMDAKRLLAVLDEDFRVICVGQFRTKREPAQNLEQWCAHAQTYGGRFLGCYGTLAALAGRVPEAAVAASAFGAAFGMLVTIADDLRDYARKGEREGNLAHLLLEGRASQAGVVALVERLRAQAASAARSGSTAHDLVPVVDLYADDVLGRGLSPYVGRR